MINISNFLCFILLLAPISNVNESFTSQLFSGCSATTIKQSQNENANNISDKNTILWTIGSEEWTITHVIGATDKINWQDDDYLVAETLDGSEVYNVYGFNTSLGIFEGSIATETAVLTQEVQLSKNGDEVNLFLNNNKGDVSESYFAIEGNWNAFPSEIVEINVADKIELFNVLCKYNYNESEYTIDDIQQAFIVDLDQDGMDELIILESNVRMSDFKNDVDKKGKYAKVFVLKLLEGANLELSIVDEYFEFEDYWYYYYHITNIMDVNGDGKLEVFVEIEGPEESVLEIYNIIDNEFIVVLSCYYGV